MLVFPNRTNTLLDKFAHRLYCICFSTWYKAPFFSGKFFYKCQKSVRDVTKRFMSQVVSLSCLGFPSMLLDDSCSLVGANGALVRGNENPWIYVLNLSSCLRMLQGQFPTGNGRLQLYMGLSRHFWVCFIRDTALWRLNMKLYVQLLELPEQPNSSTLMAIPTFQLIGRNRT